MRIPRVFTGDDGKSHFEEIEMELPHHNDLGFASDPHPVSGMVFRKTDVDYDFDFHQAPRRHFVVVLEGVLEMEVGSGDKRRLEPGTIILVEDTTGEGHIMRAAPGPGRHLVIRLE